MPALQVVACALISSIVCFAIVHPFHLQWPPPWHIVSSATPPPAESEPKFDFLLDFKSAPILGVVALRFLDVMPLSDILSCLIEVGGVKPWQVLVIFFTLAYTSISTDVTGFSQYVALTTLKQFGGGGGGSSSSSTSESTSQPRPAVPLLVVVYFLSGIIAFIASNDVVVLTLTPVLIHFCRATRTDPLPLLLVEYFAANTFSAILLVGNPTNIIIGQGLDLNFMRYAALSLFPTLSCIGTAAAIVWFAPAPTRSDNSISIGFVTPTVAVLSPATAAAPIAEKNDSQQQQSVAVATSSVNDSELQQQHHHSTTVSMTTTTTTAPLPALEPRPMDVATETAVASTTTTTIVSPSARDDDMHSLDPSLALVDPAGAKYGGCVLGGGVVLLCLSSYVPGLSLAAVTSAMCALQLARDFTVLSTDKTEAAAGARRVMQVVHRMPWAVAPFAICMFILVDALDRQGLVALVSHIIVAICALGPLAAGPLAMALAVLLTNMLNNQPAAIFSASALTRAQESMLLLSGTNSPSNTSSPFYFSDVSAGAAFAASVVSFGIGSNIGACFTIPGALAGFMWLAVLRAHGLDCSAKQFAFAGMKLMLIPTLVSGVAVGLQHVVVGAMV